MGTYAARSSQQNSDRLPPTSPLPQGGNTNEVTSSPESVRRPSEMIFAVEHVRRMRGGSQSHLMRCSDGHYYVVKFPDNPQGTRVLACDFLGTLLAGRLGLPTHPARVIEVPVVLVRSTDDLVIELPNGSMPCSAGKCFGSRCPVAKSGAIPLMMAAVDFWDRGIVTEVENVPDAAGILVFDQWTCNTDTRQLLFWRGFQERRWYLSMIDQGSCFNGARWNFPESPLWGLYHGLGPYLRDGMLAPFESWLKRLEDGIDRSVLRELASEIPQEWYGEDQAALEKLLEQLDARRSRVRELIRCVQRALPKDFFNTPWNLPDSFMVRGEGINIIPRRKSRSMKA